MTDVFTRQWQFVGNSDLDIKVAGTHPGMAHFSGTHKSPEYCMDCGFFKASRSKKGGSIDLGRCFKFTELTGKRGDLFSSKALACKYFSEEKKSDKKSASKQEPML